MPLTQVGCNSSLRVTSSLDPDARQAIGLHTAELHTAELQTAQLETAKLETAAESAVTAPTPAEWHPVAALRSAPQNALAVTLVGGIRTWIADLHPRNRRGLN